MLTEFDRVQTAAGACQGPGAATDRPRRGPERPRAARVAGVLCLQRFAHSTLGQKCSPLISKRQARPSSNPQEGAAQATSKITPCRSKNGSTCPFPPEPWPPALYRCIAHMNTAPCPEFIAARSPAPVRRRPPHHPPACPPAPLVCARGLRLRGRRQRPRPAWRAAPPSAPPFGLNLCVCARPAPPRPLTSGLCRGALMGTLGFLAMPQPLRCNTRPFPPFCPLFCLDLPPARGRAPPAGSARG